MLKAGIRCSFPWFLCKFLYAHQWYIRAAQFKSSLTTIQKDLENVKSVELSRDAKEREEMCTRIKELYSISCRYVPRVLFFQAYIWPFRGDIRVHMYRFECYDIYPPLNTCRMRVQNGFSMFNDSALLTLLQRLHSWYQRQVSVWMECLVWL